MGIREEILSGNVFIYPTDTIYGIGCDATNIAAVERIKTIKGRDKEKPLSVIAPSIRWIEENLQVDCDLKQYLPGPYTIILKKNDKNFLAHVASGETLGVRIPNSNFTRDIQKAGVPFITTSVNLSGESFAVSMKDIKGEIWDAVDLVIDIGELNGRPSTLVINGQEVKR